MIWRTEELARCACDMLERDDLAAGILLTRVVIQNAGFVWRLNELLETRNQYSPEQLRDNFERMLLPWAPVDDPLPLDSPRHSYAPYIHVGGADPRDHHARASRPTLRVITIAGRCRDVHRSCETCYPKSIAACTEPGKTGRQGCL